jgi:hypothetical protein
MRNFVYAKVKICRLNKGVEKYRLSLSFNFPLLWRFFAFHEV